MSDLIAGLTVGTILIPQSLAYAMLCNVPAVYGLYSCIVPILFYTLLASSRRLQVGPVALSSILIMVGISQNFPEVDDSTFIQLVILSTLIIGLLQLAYSLLNLGFITRFISKPVIYGFISAAAFIIIGSQLKDLLGIIPEQRGSSFLSYCNILKKIGSLNPWTVIIAISSILFLGLCKWKVKKLPAPLLLVTLAIIISYLLNLADHYKVSTIGYIPASLPSFVVPTITWSAVQNLLPVCIVISILGVAESVGMAKNMEGKPAGHILDVKQEIFAHGISKIVGSFFQSIPVSASYSRTAINDSNKAYSQVSSLISIVLVILAICFLTGILSYLPKAVLASIILVSVVGLIEFKRVKSLYHSHRGDLAIMLISFFATLLLGIAHGLFIGIVASLLYILYKSGKPQIKVLGRIGDTAYFKDIDIRKDAVEDPYIKVIRLDDQLYFGNADYFLATVEGKIESSATLPKHLILCMKNVHDLDTTGADALMKISERLQTKSCNIVFANTIYAVRKRMIKCGIIQDEESFFMTTFDAYNYLKKLPLPKK